MTSPGYVYLVGAGPGDPGLLTLKGRECLQKADLVLYDGLVNPLLLSHATAECEKAGRTDDHGVRRVHQSEINTRLIEEARAGRTVVRLKGGDPFIFGRGSEEAAALREAGIPFEVVPGVTAATTAGGYAGFPLTHRGIASAVALVTGHEDPSKPASDLDYDALAAFPGTLVFYMGLHRLPAIASALIEAGKPSTTPAAVVSRASTPRQRTVTAPLGQIADEVQAANLRPPSLIVVGECVTFRERIAWFERRPLFGVSVGIVRPDSRSDDAIAEVLALGGEPIALPTIEIGRPEHYDDLDGAIRSIDRFTHLALTSANAVAPFFERLASAGRDGRALGRVRTACVGPSTAAELARYSIGCDILPEVHNAEALADGLLNDTDRPFVLWPCSDRGRDALPSRVTAGGGEVVAAIAYENRDTRSWPLDTLARVREGLDFALVASPSAARSLAKLWPADAPRPRIVAASPLTADAVRDAGWACQDVSRSPLFAEMLSVVLSSSASSGR